MLNVSKQDRERGATNYRNLRIIIDRIHSYISRASNDASKYFAPKRFRDIPSKYARAHDIVDNEICYFYEGYYVRLYLSIVIGYILLRYLTFYSQMYSRLNELKLGIIVNVEASRETWCIYII